MRPVHLIASGHSAYQRSYSVTYLSRTVQDGSGGSKVLVRFSDGRSNGGDDPVAGKDYVRCVHDPI